MTLYLADCILARAIVSICSSPCACYHDVTNFFFTACEYDGPNLELEAHNPPLKDEFESASSNLSEIQSPKPTTVSLGDKRLDMGTSLVGTLVGNIKQHLSPQRPEFLAPTPTGAIEEIFHQPVPSNSSGQDLLSRLPSYDHLRRLTRTAFAHAYPLSNIVSDSQLMNVLDQMRKNASWPNLKRQSDLSILLHAVIALGYLCSATVHLESGCHYARNERYVGILPMAIGS